MSLGKSDCLETNILQWLNEKKKNNDKLGAWGFYFYYLCMKVYSEKAS